MNYYQKWADAAIADGYQEIPGGPWSIQKTPHERDDSTPSGYAVTGERREGDLSILLTKDDIRVWLVDRALSNGRRDVWTAAWFENGGQAFKLPPEYSSEAVEAERGRCSNCGELGDPSRLEHFRFAERLCPKCDTKGFRAEGEFPGWYN